MVRSILNRSLLCLFLERYSGGVSGGLWDKGVNCAGGEKGKVAKGTKCTNDCVEHSEWWRDNKFYTDYSNGWGSPCGWKYCLV